MSALPIRGYSPNRQDYIDDPDKFNNPMLGRSMPRPDDVYNRGQAPVEMPMPPAPIATETVLTSQPDGASFESDYIDWLRSKPVQPGRPKGMGAASKSYQKANREYKENLKQWEASEPSRAMYSTAPVTTAPTEPAPTEPFPPEFMPPPTETPDKFEGRYVPPTSNLGTPDSLIPSNIVGQSYDPGFAARFFAGGTGETNVDAGNGMGMMVMPQRPEPPVGSVFGGYGQQAPMQALAPYAGMAQSQPMPTDFFPTYIPRPDPIYETVPRPETNQPAPQPNAQPVMSSNIPGAIPGNTPGVDFNVFENPMGSYVR